MMMEWLEPKIKDRIDHAVDNCCDDHRVKDLYNEYMRVLHEKCPELVIDLEYLFNASFRLGADLAYRNGFRDGIELGMDVSRKFAPNLHPTNNRTK
ncbi:hypothetical protein [Paenibacillus sp. HJGM_3]|uniref:hypothetical protein n=1 Tax=Paenibacillus sp. HJGM_3 TaxID=3379816 RepID=UPI00385C6038